MKVSIETNVKKPKSYKVLSEAEIKKEATKLSKDDNKYVADVGKAVLKVLVKGAIAVTDLLSAVNVLIFTTPAILADVLLLVISALILIVSMTPSHIISKALSSQRRFLKSILKNINEPTKQYLDTIDDIAKERFVITEESTNGLILTPSVESITNWDILLEAPKEDDEPIDYTKDVDNPDEDDKDEPKDYTEDVTTDDEPETVDETDDKKEEPIDYTQDVQSDGDDNDTATEDEDTSEEPIDYTQDVQSDDTNGDNDNDTNEDVTTDNEPETVDDTSEEPIDYTQDVQSDGDDNDTATEDEDTSEDDTTDNTGEDTTSDTTADNTNDENTIVKNYNLLVDFQNMHKTIGEILDSLHDIVYPQPIQNQVLTKGINNLQEIREQIEKYINYSFSDDYKRNTYYYTVYLQASKMNLEMLRKNYQLDKE